MAISTYSELKTAVANWIHRTDLTTRIPDFISIAETKLNRRIRVRAMEDQATGTISSSVNLPTGFVEMIGLTASIGGYTYPITYVKPSELTGVSSTAIHYSLIGDTLRFDPGGSGQTYTLTYYKAIPALSDSNTTNWLLTASPDVYLYASCLEACEYTRDVARIEEFNALLDTSITRLQDADKKDRYGSDLIVRPA